MEKNEKQLTYETPEAEAIEIRMENSFMAGSNENNEECTEDTCDLYFG